VDCYLGPDEDAPMVYVVHQLKAPAFKEFDESKVMLGFDNRAQAEAAYLAHYDSPDFFGDIDEIPIEQFRENVLAGEYRGSKIVKGGVSGQAYDGRHRYGSSGSGAWLVDEDKQIGRIIQLTSMMDAAERLVNWEAREKRVTVETDTNENPMAGGFYEPHPPPDTDEVAPVGTAEARAKLAERGKERWEQWQRDKFGAAASIRDLKRWHL
jgi:hypothetical protein